jgi:hypothetical protein
VASPSRTAQAASLDLLRSGPAFFGDHYANGIVKGAAFAALPGEQLVFEGPDALLVLLFDALIDTGAPVLRVLRRLLLLTLLHRRACVRSRLFGYLVPACRRRPLMDALRCGRRRRR